MIRDEIGPDAVILDSNPVRSKGIGGLFKQGVEVVAAYEPSAAQKSAEKAVSPQLTVARINKEKAAAPQSTAPIRPVNPPLHGAQSVAARYSAATRPEPMDSARENEENLGTKLEPVMFPVLDLRGSKPAAEPEAPVEPAAAVKTEPRRTPEAETVRNAVVERLLHRAEEASASLKRPAFLEYQPEPEPLRDEIASLKDTVQAFAQRVNLMTKDPALTLPPDILSLYSSLVDRDVPEEIARRVAVMAQAAQTRRTVKAETAARQIVMDKLGEPVPIHIRPYRQNVLFFVGPTGAGKTTTLVKLAGMLALEHKLRVGFVNMDTYRIGAMEHLRIYADIMNIPLHTAYSAADLSEALAQMADRDVVLVDTAGKATSDEGYRQDMAEWISAAKADEVFLVLSVATGHRAVREIVHNYAFLPDYKLIMTKLDEVNAWGNVLHIRELAGKPLSYVTMGQNVPDDIRPVDTKRIADNIVGRKVCAL